MTKQVPYLARLTLKRTDASVAPLLRDLLPVQESTAMGLHHRLLWTVYANTQRPSEGKSAFLWRHMDGNGRFMVLGPEPMPENPYFDIESKPFDVRFHAGQRLMFDLRLNATKDISSSEGGRKKSQRTDIVMTALHTMRQTTENDENQPNLREEAALHAVQQWMASRQERNGFSLENIHVKGYRAVPPPGGKSPRGSLVGICDVHGMICVTDPDMFLERLLAGLGRMKAYGCGLMLVKPVR